MDNNRNTLLAIALSLLVLLGWQFLYVNPKLDAERKAAEIERIQNSGEQGGAPAAQSGAQTAQPGQPSTAVPGSGPAVPGTAGVQQELGRDQAIAKSPRVPVENSDIIGSINLKGGRLDDLRLKNYRVTIDRNSPLVTLLSPADLRDGYFAEFGWVGSATSGEVPGPETVWSAPQGAVVGPGKPVVLTWTSPSGITFTRTIALDEHYMFTVSDKVANNTAADVAMAPYGRVTRFEKPVSQANYVLHEGMIGVLGEEGLHEITYSSIEEDRSFTTPAAVNEGWLGITDKYWAAVMSPSGEYQPRFSFFDDGRQRFQADFLGSEMKVAAGQSLEVTQKLFAGAKEVDVIDNYETSLGIKNFELLIDWGWFYFITKPMFWLIDTLYQLLGNFGLAILATTVVVKAIFFPLANKSYASMANMKMVQPKMLEIREKYADDKMKQQQAMMELYKAEKINPLAGCWPILIQIPVFFALYKVLYVTIEMRHAPFFGWIQDLAAPDPTSIFNLFGLLPYSVPLFLMIGVWPLIMGVTMF
ncbi:MAG TPA: membrane protein insertase YidC, partial [Rhizobiaceae bacterium]|nr:membrane protein insertase YidC [Rhizobiaceae bacterium]